MARDFNGTTDRIDYPPNGNFKAAAITVSLWINIDTLAQGDIPFAIQDSGEDGFEYLWMRIGAVAGGTTDWGWVRWGDTFEGRQSNTGVLSTGSWINLVVTDGGAFTDATDIHLYRNGAEETYAVTQNGVGTESTFSGSWIIGGREASDTRNVDGRICEVAVWDRALSAGEAASLGKGFSPAFFANGLVFYAPLIGKSTTETDIVNGKAGTLDGTSAAAHPRIYHPANYRTFPFAAAGATSIKTVNSLAEASVKTVNSLANASVKTWNSLA